jgi:hypothetical protein
MCLLCLDPNIVWVFFYVIARETEAESHLRICVVYAMRGM